MRWVPGIWNSDELLHRGLGVQNHVESGLDGEGHEPFGDAHDGHQQNAGCKSADRVGSADSARSRRSSSRLWVNGLQVPCSAFQDPSMESPCAAFARL